MKLLETPKPENIITILIITIIPFFLATQLAYDDTTNLIVSLAAISVGAFVAVYCFKLVVKYVKTKVFGLSFAWLGISYLFYAIAESLYVYFDVMGMPTYPSVTDFFYGVYYTAAIVFVYHTLRYFARHIPINGIVIIAIIVSASAGFYAVASMGLFDEVDGMEYAESDAVFDFVYGGAFVALSSILLGFAIVALHTMRRSDDLAFPWLLIAIVLIVSSTTDIYYYTLENIGVYQYGNIVDTVWFATDVLMLVALWYHKKVIT